MTSLRAVAIVCALVAVAATPRERSIYVSVEEHGRPATGLTTADFELELDDRSIPFRLEPAERPANITVLAENSIDSRYSFGNEIRQALRSLVHAPADYRYGLVTFARSAWVNVDFDSRPAQLAKAYDKAEPLASEVNLSAALHQLVDRRRRLAGRQVVVILASDADLSVAQNGITMRHLLDHTNIVVFVCGLGGQIRVNFGGYPSAVRDRQGFPADVEATLHSLSAATGGWAWFPSFAGDVDNAVREILIDIEHQYRLVFDADVPTDGKLHDIDVHAYRTYPNGEKKRLTVRAKRGWRVEGT